MNKKNNRKGFTITELVIVIAVIAILAAVLIPTFTSIIDKANDSADLQEARAAYTEYTANIDYSEALPVDPLYVPGGEQFFLVTDGSMDADPIAEVPAGGSYLVVADDGTFSVETVAANAG